MENTEYAYIPKNTLESFKINSQLFLSEKEIVSILKNREILSRFINLKASAIQFDIGSGKFRGKEDVLFGVIEILNQISEEIKTIDTTWKKAKAEQQEIEKSKKDLP